jgi:hypothetical protein
MTTTWRADRMAAVAADEAWCAEHYPPGTLARQSTDLRLAMRRSGIEVASALRLPQVVDWLAALVR